MSFDKNEIYLRRKNKVLLEKGNGSLSKPQIATFLKNLESLGYVLSKELIERVKTLNESEVMNFSNNLISCLKDMTGSSKVYNPMYPNFPKQVMNAEEAELYMNAIVHYGSLDVPEYDKKERSKLREKTKLNTIDLGNEKDFINICKNLIGSNTSISSTDKEDVSWFVNNYKKDVLSILPDEIPFKENLSYVTGLLLTITNNPGEILSRYFKVATDVLRLATSMSEGDVSLSENSKFRKFSRSERKLFLSLLNSCNNSTEDMLRHKNKWICLGKHLRVGDYEKQFPKAIKSFDIIRNNKPFYTRRGMVENSLNEKRFLTAAELLKERPGEFARRLDHLLRSSKPDQSDILNRFSEVSDKVSTPVLLQCLNHFKSRTNLKGKSRSFFPKGNVSKMKSIEWDLPLIDKNICNKVVSICSNSLIKRFSTLAPLGKTYLSDDLENYIVPFSQRSASKSLRTLVRGSKIPIAEGKCIRFFIWWENSESRVDIDLSMIAFDKNWNMSEQISYTRLRSDQGIACHSGDIVNAPNGACEFIDIKIDKAMDKGVRFILPVIYSFTKQKFSDIPECFTGWMMRKEPMSGEIFEPKTLENRYDLNSGSVVSIPAIFDLEERQYTWADLSMRSRDQIYSSRVENSSASLQKMAKAMVELNKPNLKELLSLHVKARGTLVKDKDEAQTIFSVEEGITPFDTETIMGEFMR